MWFCLFQVFALSEGKMPGHWNWEDERKWKEEKKKKKKKKQEYFDSYNFKGSICNISNLNEITVILFDLLECEQVEIIKYKHFKNKNKIIRCIKNYINKYQDNNYVFFSVWFVLLKAKDNYTKLPTIKFLICDKNTQIKNNIFTHLSCRVYKNWQDCMTSVTLPYSPAGKRGRKVLRDLENASTVLSVAATGVAIAAMCFPVAMPVSAC